MLFRSPVVAALVIGFSRIYLGAHWTTDVLAGWVFGALWGLGWIYGLLWIYTRQRISTERNRSAGR